MSVLEEFLRRMRQWPEEAISKLNGKQRPERRWRKLSVGVPVKGNSEELLQACMAEADAEWCQELVITARAECKSIITVDARDPTNAAIERFIDAFAAQSKDLRNPIIIATPTAIALLKMAVGTFRRVENDAGLKFGNLKQVATLQGIPVLVDEYASDSTINLICDEGWFEVDYDRVIEASSIGPGFSWVADPDEAHVRFKTDVSFTVHGHKLRGVGVECITLGFL